MVSVADRLKEIRSGTDNTKARCPGESSCEMFQSEYGATREEKEIGACTGGDPEKPSCHMFPTKYKPVNEENAELKEVERFIAKRRSGFNPDPLDLTNSEYEAVLYWDWLEWQYAAMQSQIPLLR